MKKLLIIDDDPLLREALESVFAGIYAVQSVASAEAATPLIESCCPDVILLDIALTGMSGLTYLHVLQKNFVDVPVVMISGAVSNRQAVAALEGGAFDFIRKPFEIGELRLKVARALAHAALVRRIAELEERDRTACVTGEVGAEVPLKEAVERFERERIVKALDESGGVITRAAEKMGTTRRILQYRIQKLCIGGFA